MIEKCIHGLLWILILPILQVFPTWASDQVTTATSQEAVEHESAADEVADEALESLLLEHTQSSFQPKLDIYGFADFTYHEFLMQPSNSWYNLVEPHSTFMLGNLNLYLRSSVGSSLQSLAEVRFTYMPHGQYQIQPSGDYVRLDTNSPDPNNFARSEHWGGVVIERAWVEYKFLDEVSIRVGQWITPVGIWNVDHASPTIISAGVPFIVGEKLFPRNQTGLQLRGTFSFSSLIVDYSLTLSNGRGPLDTYQDLDHNKALGGRISVATHVVGHLQMGLSAYRGQYTNRNKTVSFSPDSTSVQIKSEITERFEELSLAADLRWQIQGLIIQSEWILNERAWSDTARPPIDFQNGFQRDYRAWGVYGLLAYQLPWFNLMPFVFVEYIDRGSQQSVRDSFYLNLGLNIRPLPVLVLKAQYSHGWMLRHNENSMITDPLSLLTMQVAWSF